MTGAYLRVKRGDKWENIEVEHLTDDEIREKFATREPQELINWMIMLCQQVREVEPLLLSLEKDGIISRVRDTPPPDDE
jgi:hypothetical protein